MRVLPVSLAGLATKMSLGLVAALCVLPFLYHHNALPIVSYHSEWLAVLLGLLAVLTALPVLLSGFLALPRVALLPLGLVAFLFLQTQLLSPIVNEHVQTAIAYLLWAALLIIFSYNLRQSLLLSHLVQTFAVALLVGAVLVTVIEIALRFVPKMTEQWGGLGQLASYTDYLSLGLASGLYCWAKREHARHWLKVLLVAAITVVVFGLSLGSSSASWVYWLALLVLAFLSPNRHSPALKQMLLAVLVLFAFIQALADFGGLPAKLHLPTASERILDEVDGAPIRWHLWRAAGQLFLQTPWLGQGFGQFDWGYFTLGNALPALPDRIDNAHNLFMQVLSEMGVFPFIGLLIGLGFWLQGLIKTPATLERWWLLGLLAIIGLHSLVEYPLWYSYFLGIAALMLGLGEQQAYPLTVNTPVKWGVGLVLPVLLALCVNHFNSYRQLEKLVEPLNYTDWIPSMPDFIKGAQEISTRTPELVPYISVVLSSLDKSKGGDVTGKLPVSEKALGFMPTAQQAYRHVLLLALADQPQAATTLLQQALKAYPSGAAEFVKDLKDSSPEVQQKTEYLVKMVNG